MGDQSFYLFAVPTFLAGAAAVMDPSDSLSTYNGSPAGMDADAIILYADWMAVAGDLNQAVGDIACHASLVKGVQRCEKIGR